MEVFLKNNPGYTTAIIENDLYVIPNISSDCRKHTTIKFPTYRIYSDNTLGEKKIQSLDKATNVGGMSVQMYCGTDYNDANTRCQVKCYYTDEACAPYPGEECFTTANCPTFPAPPGPAPAPAPAYKVCGTSWPDAKKQCKTQCPGGKNAECLPSETCKGDVPCESAPPTLPPSPPVSNCGTDAEDARQHCRGLCTYNTDCSLACLPDTVCGCYSGTRCPTPAPAPTPTPPPKPANHLNPDGATPIYGNWYYGAGDTYANTNFKNDGYSLALYKEGWEANFPSISPAITISNDTYVTKSAFMLGTGAFLDTSPTSVDSKFGECIDHFSAKQFGPWCSTTEHLCVGNTLDISASSDSLYFKSNTFINFGGWGCCCSNKVMEPLNNLACPTNGICTVADKTGGLPKCNSPGTKGICPLGGGQCYGSGNTIVERAKISQCGIPGYFPEGCSKCRSCIKGFNPSLNGFYEGWGPCKRNDDLSKETPTECKAYTPGTKKCPSGYSTWEEGPSLIWTHQRIEALPTGDVIKKLGYAGVTIDIEGVDVDRKNMALTFHKALITWAKTIKDAGLTCILVVPGYGVKGKGNKQNSSGIPNGGMEWYYISDNTIKTDLHIHFDYIIPMWYGSINDTPTTEEGWKASLKQWITEGWGWNQMVLGLSLGRSIKSKAMDKILNPKQFFNMISKFNMQDGFGQSITQLGGFTRWAERGGLINWGKAVEVTTGISNEPLCDSRTYRSIGGNLPENTGVNYCGTPAPPSSLRIGMSRPSWI